MPMSKDAEGGGAEKDGSRSAKYCSHCYQGGAFTQPSMTAAEMKDLVKSKMKEMGFPGILAGFFTAGIPKLERWRN